MKSLRRLLGVLVMIAGVLGLVISLTGLVGVWALKPTVSQAISGTIDTLSVSLAASDKIMGITADALDATVTSVDALSTMLDATASSLEDTKPLLEQLNDLMGKVLPATMEQTNLSLKAAQTAATVLESTMKSLDNFRMVLSAMPLFGALVEKPEESYNPEKPLAESLDEMSTTLKDMPVTFSKMATNLDKADDNLGVIQENLVTMSKNTTGIATSLREYQSMISESQDSVQKLNTTLTNIQTNLPSILSITAIALSLFLLWLLVIQVVVFSQGLELFRGTAGHMAAEEVPAAPPTEPASEA